MRILIAGGTSTLGSATIPLLIAEGHEVAATTRSPERTADLRDLGAAPFIVDAFDAPTLDEAVRRAEPDVIMNLMTDLRGGDSASNAHLRTVGTRNLVNAARRNRVTRMIAESISWVYEPGTDLATEHDPLDREAPEPRRTTVAGVDALERATRELPGGTVLRLGQLYGPGTWYASDGKFGEAARSGNFSASAAVTSFLHIDDAAHAIAAAIAWSPGTWNIVDDEPAPGSAWAPAFAQAVGATEYTIADTPDVGRPVSNAAARANGLELQHPTWRDGFATL